MPPSLLDRVRTAVGISRKAVQDVGIVMTLPWERRLFPPQSFRALSTNGLKGNSAVFACASALIEGYVEPPLKVYAVNEDGKVEVPDHDLAKLLANPNEDMSMSELLEFVITYKFISGSSYLYKVRSAAGRVVELWPLSDFQMRPIAGGNRLVDHFEFGWMQGSPTTVDKKDVIHLKWKNDPVLPWMGLGPLEIVLKEVCTDSEATSYLYALLSNDAVPRMKLKIPPSARNLTKEQKDEIREDFHQTHGGPNRGKLFIEEGGAELSAIGMNMRDLEFNKLHLVPESRIAAVSGVPGIVAGLYVGLEQMTRDNVEGMEIHFTERKLVPLWKKDQAEISQNLVPDFYDGKINLEIEFDTSEVLALQLGGAGRQNLMRDWAIKGLASGGLLVNEFRDILGYDPDANGNIYLRGPLMQAVDFVPQEKVPNLGKAKGKPEVKSYEEVKRIAEIKAARKFAVVLRGLRLMAVNKAEPEIKKYFKDLASKVVEKIRLEGKSKSHPTDWITPEDEAALKKLIGSQALALLKESWSVINESLGEETEFSEGNPIIFKALADMGSRIVAIDQATLDEVKNALQEGFTRGWDINHMINGDAEAGIRGIKDIVEELYSHRAENIARTELGTMQNQATIARYQDAGVGDVYVFDGDDANPCEICEPYADGETVWTLEQAQANPLEHPYCCRAFGPVVV